MQMTIEPQARRLVGWLPDKTIPAHIQQNLPEKVSFTTVHKTFTAKASSTAQNGNDYDIPNEPPCFDQLDEGSCVLNGTTGAASILLSVERQTVVNLSRNFPYWLCREVMGTLTQDSGTYVALAVALLGVVGSPRESTFPYVDATGNTTLYTPPTPDCYPEASDNVITAWFNIPDQNIPGQPSRLDQIEAAVRSNHPVVFGTQVDSAIQNYTAGQILSVPSGRIIGGHCMDVTGVRYISGKRVWRWRNSWSPQYGDNGHLLVDDNWMNWAGLTDMWVLTRMDPVLF